MPDDPRKTSQRLQALARTTLAKTKGDKLGFLEDTFVLAIAPAVKLHTTLKAAVVWISNHLNPEDVFTKEQLVSSNDLKQTNKFRIKASDIAKIVDFIKQESDAGRRHDSIVAPIITFDGKELYLDIDMHNRDNVEVNKDVK